MSRTQVEALRKNCAEFGVRLHPMGDADQGIVHVIGPQLGLTQPGLTIVCGDSHTSTHGALGALAFGIGTSEVEHVLATQTLPQARPKTMAITVDGALPEGVTAKDLILAIIAKIGTGGGQGYVLEYRGPAIRALTMAGRLTVCNMSIEAGARAGLVAPDDVTFAYLEGRPHAPSGAAWEAALDYWRTLPTDADATFDNEVVLDAATLSPYVTWGTNPGQALPLASSVPDPGSFADPAARVAAERALTYMDLKPGTALRDVAVDTVFVGSCTNGRIEDLRAAATVLQGRQVAPSVRMLVVPGSMAVRAQAEREGLDAIFTAAGADWRSAGCSMCLGMNPDKLSRGPAQRVHVQPQLRGPSGQGRAHPPGLAGSRRRHRRDRPPGRARRPVEEPPDMEPFVTHAGRAVPLRRSNVDTDQIIPAEYLKRVSRAGFGEGLFAAWREDPSFVLNQPQYEGATILVAGKDFGTGSSREHAVWALTDYGFRAVIAPRFGDIFRGNSTKAGLLPVVLPEAAVAALQDAVEAEPATEVVVDLDNRLVTAEAAGIKASFEIDDYTRWRLMEGLDDIGLTLRHVDGITAFEHSRPAFLPVTA